MIAERSAGLFALLMLGLSGCGSSGDVAGAAGAEGLPASPTLAAAQSSGPGTTDAAKCNVPFGNPPAPPATLTSGLGSGALGNLLSLTNQCLLVGGEILTWTDRTNDERRACLITPPHASSSNPLPLVVFLQASLAPLPPQMVANNWPAQTRTADLTGDPNRPGFILLLPFARVIRNFYPYPDDHALGWDNWYRNLDRNSPELNLDVAAVDAFVVQARARENVDDDRIYLSGWSNGGAMAQLFSLHTPWVAATAVYSAPAPFSDWQDPCEQTPFATALPPVMDIHNACDVIDTCRTTVAYHEQMASLFPRLKQNAVIIDGLQNQTDACDMSAMCTDPTLGGNPIGLANHVIWPQSWNDQMFRWLREHPLSSRR